MRLSICFTAIAVTLAFPYGFKSSSEDGFKLASEKLKQSLNMSADPCTDFYNFACGKWIHDNPISSDKSSVGTLEHLNDKVMMEMKGLFESEVKSASKAIRMVKSLYKICMKEDGKMSKGPQILLGQLENFGFLPMIHQDLWNPSAFDLTKLLTNVRVYKGDAVFVAYAPVADLKNVTRKLLYFDQGDLSLPNRQIYVNKEMFQKQINAYKSYISETVRLLTEDAGLPVNSTEIKLDVDEMFEFETKFAEITVEVRKDLEAMYNPVKLSQMKELMPLIDWDKLLHGVLPPSTHPYLAEDPTFIVTELDYQRRLTELLKATDPRVLTNFILVRFILAWGMELGEKYEAVRFKFNQEFSGLKVKPPRWQTCLGGSSFALRDASGAMYIRDYFSEETKKSTATMIESLQSSFENVLIEADWMENSTKKYAIEKLASMKHMIGYPDFMLDDKQLDQRYDGLDVTDSDSLIDAGRKVIFFTTNASFAELLKPVDRTAFPMSPATVNAFYSAQTNTMVFLAAFLQLPLFHKDYPKVLNYGGLGSVVGHEMTHGFDDTGRLFDKIGNLAHWWDNKTAKAFAEKSECFVDQYGSIEIPGTRQKINGKFTLGENIADNGGVKEAYRAFKKFEEESGAERPIPGFEGYSNDQMFYIGYAQPWCSQSTPEFAELKLLVDPHSPKVYRVNTVLSNQAEFAEAFKCPANSPMNPNSKCAVW